MVNIPIMPSFDHIVDTPIGVLTITEDMANTIAAMANEGLVIELATSFKVDPKPKLVNVVLTCRPNKSQTIPLPITPIKS